MTSIKRKIVRYLLILVLLLSACSPAAHAGSTTPASSMNGSCIPPVAALAYPVGIPPSPNAKNTEIAPSGGWQQQAVLPGSTGIDYPQIFTRPGEVWVLAVDAKKVLRYRIDSHEWKSYNTMDDLSVVPRNLFRTHDGTLWGIDSVSFGADSKRSFSFLSRYNAVTDKFEFVTDNNGLLAEGMAISDPIQVTQDSENGLWFFGSRPGDDSVGLYSFDLTTHRAEKRLSFRIGASYVGPVVAPGGDIWFYNGWERALFIYSPAAREVRQYYGLPIFDKYTSVNILFFDRDGRLWLDNKGWLDFADPAKPVWYETIPSPVFLTDNGWFDIRIGDGQVSRYGWEVPSWISQSSNGWFWFTTGRGTIRLEPQNGEWCLFTTGGSPVVEDDNKNLWIAVFDKLYKFQLEP